MRLMVRHWWAWFVYYRGRVRDDTRRWFFRWFRCPLVGHRPKMALRGRCVECGFDTWKYMSGRTP